MWLSLKGFANSIGSWRWRMAFAHTARGTSWSYAVRPFAAAWQHKVGSRKHTKCCSSLCHVSRSWSSHLTCTLTKRCKTTLGHLINSWNRKHPNPDLLFVKEQRWFGMPFHQARSQLAERLRWLRSHLESTNWRMQDILHRIWSFHWSIPESHVGRK